MDETLAKLKKISNSFKRINAKITLLKLIEKAKSEYDSYDFESSEKSLKKAYKLDTHNATILRGLGCMQQFKKNYTKSLEYYREALKYSLHKEMEYTLIGTVYYLQDQLDEAIENFNLAIEANNNYEKAYEGKNQAMLENHVKILDFQDALKKYF